jgi:hypothetical protein
MLKESRKIKLFTGLQVHSRKFSTPQAAARALSREMANRVYTSWQSRQATNAARRGGSPVAYSWARRNEIERKAYARILPRIMWVTQRKVPKDSK